MSIDAVTKKEYTSTSSQTVYDNHAIPFLHQDDLEVWIKDNNTAGDYGAGKAVLQQTGVSSGAALTSTHPQVAKTRKPELSTSIKQIGYSIDTNGKVTLNAAPTTGSTVIISRATRDGSGKYTSFTNGSVLKASDINLALDQVRYQAQEARNGIMGGVAGADSATADTVDTELLAEATDSAKGVVKVGTNLSISSGTVSVADATDSVKGVVKVGTNLSVSSGTVSVIDATTSAKGVVKVGSNLSVSSGTVSVADGTASVKGVAKVGTNISLSSGTISVADGSTSAKGVVQLSDSTTSTSTSLAATANAIKVTKAVADNALPKGGGTMTGAIAMGTKKITGLGDPTSDQDAATKKYITDNYYTKTAADTAFFNVSTGDTIKDGDTFPDNDTSIATTAAINDRIIDLVDDVGGFVPIASENHFPTTNPDVNDNAGTLVSIKALSENIVTGSGVTTNNSVAQTTGGTAVTITGLTESTTYAAGFGMIVETTSTLNTYAFHRLVPKATEVTTVAGKATEITTVAGKATEITTCHSKATEITTCHSKATEITTCHTNATDIETVADNITDVSNFADLYQIATSAPSTDGGGNSLAVGDLWFDSSSNKALKVHNGTSFQAVSPTQSVLDDIAIVSGDLTRQEDLGSIADALASATTTSDLETCADNITNINTFANVYRIAASAPSTSLDEGDLWYDSTSNKLKYYTGSAWTVTAGAGLSALADDTSPELAGNLDCNDKNLTEVATVSGDNLQIDFGTL